MGKNSFCQFQKNALGRFRAIQLDDSHTDSNNPYRLSIEEQSSNLLRISTPVQPESSFTGDPFQNAIVIPSQIKTYYVVVPRGARLFFTEESASVAEKRKNALLDAELWCAWRRFFGFSKIPIDFTIQCTLRLQRGTQIIISYNDDYTSPEACRVFVNRWDLVSTGYPLYVKVSTFPTRPFLIPPDIYYPNTGGVGISYGESDDESFQIFFPELYKTC